MAESVPAAAQALGVSTATLRRWIRQGCPTVILGDSGRGRGSRVDVPQVQRWRAGANATLPVSGETGAELQQALARSLADTYRRGSGVGQTAAQQLNIPSRHVALVLVMAYERLARDLTGESPSEFPQCLADLAAIAAETAHR